MAKDEVGKEFLKDGGMGDAKRPPLDLTSVYLIESLTSKKLGDIQESIT